MENKIVIHGEWVTLNEYINAERTHRQMAAKIKREEMERMLWTLKGVLPMEGKINVTFQAFVTSQRKDPDNLYIYFCKSFLDSLVKLGIIPNDGQKNIGRIVFQPVQIGEERMEIVIEKSMVRKIIYHPHDIVEDDGHYAFCSRHPGTVLRHYSAISKPEKQEDWVGGVCYEENVYVPE